MNIFQNIFNDSEKCIGLCSLGLSGNNSDQIYNNLYKNNYNKLLFKIELVSPVKVEKSFIDQTLYHPS